MSSIFISRFIDVNLDTAMQRVETRHISTGTQKFFFLILKRLAATRIRVLFYSLFVLRLTGKPPDVAKWRVKALVLLCFCIQLYGFKSFFFEVSCLLFGLQIDYNDRPNAELIVKSKANADVLIRSISF